MRLFSRPFLQSLNGRLMLQSALRDMVVVGREIELQRRLKFVGRRESGLLNQVADSPVEALDHAVRLCKRRGHARDGVTLTTRSGPTFQHLCLVANALHRHLRDFEQEFNLDSHHRKRKTGVRSNIPTFSNTSQFAANRPQG